MKYLVEEYFLCTWFGFVDWRKTRKFWNEKAGIGISKIERVEGGLKFKLRIRKFQNKENGGSEMLRELELQKQK